MIVLETTCCCKRVNLVVVEIIILIIKHHLKLFCGGLKKEFSAELGIGTYDGLSLVDTNTYFLITKNAASLTSKGSATKKSRPGQNLRQRLRDAPPGIQKSIAIWRSEKQKG